MSRTIYALLVGINDYLGGVTGLNGCVNDVKRMAEFLQLRTQGGEFELKPLTLTSGDRANASEVKPTRQVVIDGFRTHLCQAGPDDVALFYYSGHGSQEKAPSQRHVRLHARVRPSRATLVRGPTHLPRHSLQSPNSVIA